MSQLLEFQYFWTDNLLGRIVVRREKQDFPDTSCHVYATALAHASTVQQNPYIWVYSTNPTNTCKMLRYALSAKFHSPYQFALFDRLSEEDALRRFN